MQREIQEGLPFLDESRLRTEARTFRRLQEV
jgi:hypothetical protein